MMSLPREHKRNVTGGCQASGTLRWPNTRLTGLTMAAGVTATRLQRRSRMLEGGGRWSWRHRMLQRQQEPLAAKVRPVDHVAFRQRMRAGQRLESQIDRAARAWSVHAHSKTNCDTKSVDLAYNRLHNAIRTARMCRVRKGSGVAKLVFGMNQSLDGYVDHMALEPKPHALAPLHRGGSGAGGQCVRSPNV